MDLMKYSVTSFASTLLLVRHLQSDACGYTPLALLFKSSVAIMLHCSIEDRVVEENGGSSGTAAATPENLSKRGFFEEWKRCRGLLVRHHAGGRDYVSKRWGSEVPVDQGQDISNKDHEK